MFFYSLMEWCSKFPNQDASVYLCDGRAGGAVSEYTSYPLEGDKKREFPGVERACPLNYYAGEKQGNA